ncbi:hypothetical protein ACJA29_02525 [Metamycoplasma sualvi]|uniref:hypothetical protein n=1 Tax=Metamycoplasma sualvi TaxID=2125 RepID=UPI003872BF6E
MKTKFLLGTTILLGTSLLPLSVISYSNQVTSSEGDNKPSNPGDDNTNPLPPTDNNPIPPTDNNPIPPTDNNPIPPTDNEGENKPSNPGDDNTNPKPPTDNEGQQPLPPTDNEQQQPSQPTIVYREITGYNDINIFIKNNTEIVSNLISQVDKTFGSLISHEWVVDPQIIYDNMKVKKNEDGYIYIDITGVTFSSVTLKYKYLDKQNNQKEFSISTEGKSVNIELHFKSEKDFIGGIF